MSTVVMNNYNFIATHLRTVVQYIMKCETTTKIYSLLKLNTLIYVHCVLFCFGLCFILSLSRNKYFFETRFVIRNF